MARGKIFILFIGLILLSVSFARAEDMSKPSVKITPYGFIKLDMAYDEARTNNGNYAMYVNNVSSAGDKDNEYNMTARQTRLGANFNVAGIADQKITGKIEMDFYNASAENKNAILLRQAYLKVEYEKIFILAGQAYDIISPLLPSTVNYPVLWNCGNIGYRRPMIQIGNVTKKGIEVVGALSRNIAGDLDGDGNDDGEDASLPTVQGRISYVDKGINIGISGHYGRMERNDFTSGREETYNSCSINGHFSLALTPVVTVKGEAFSGKTLGQYLGGIGQSFDHVSGTELKSSGGWINLTLKANQKTTLSAGAGLDDPEDDKINGFPVRTSNMCIFGNVQTQIAYNTIAGVEVSNWRTGYQPDDKVTSSIRIQGSLMFKF